MKKEKHPMTNSTPPTYPNRAEARRFGRREFMLALGGSTAASVLFSCSSKAPSNSEDPKDRLPGKPAPTSETSPPGTFHLDTSPSDTSPADTSPSDTGPSIEVADSGFPPASASVPLRISLPGPTVWSSDEPKLQGRSTRLSDGTRVSYALLFESTDPGATQILREKRGALMRIADSRLQNKCDYSSVATTVAQRQLNKRSAKWFDGVLKGQDIAFLEIKFIRVQGFVGKKGVRPRFHDEIDM